ncbi:beta-galactosidase trimerization domain-containing protein [Paenibacillus koleovorans]|uniref:beta-galactosidase trimerization domain-containing protein n=1 Tax=Paenibacillus koleovorans TaxID=121608 RepID=UPI000FD95542|nr:beta-galactosidase trimerization domain-containing protein [Paenibacillus koleovorans]
MTQKRFDIRYSTAIATEYPEKLRSFVNGKLKVFFVPSVRYGREIVEFIQRTDIDYETVTYDKAWDLNKWGIGDFYDVRAAIDDFRAIHQNLEDVLTSDEHFDVLVIPGVNGWAHFPAAARQAILRRVEAGAGLVLIRPFHGQGMEPSEELNRLSPLRNLVEEGLGDDPNAGGGFPQTAYDRHIQEAWLPVSAESNGGHYITSGIPFDQFPYGELAYYPYEAVGETILRGESGQPIAAVQPFGKGRVVAFGYYPRDILPQHSAFTGKESTFDAIIENWGGSRTSVTFPFLEYFYELIYRSVVWAAGQESPSRIESIEVAAAVGEEFRVSVGVAAEAPDGYTLRYAVRNAYDLLVAEGETPSASAIRLPEQLRLGGDYRVEVSLLADGRLLDWGTASLSVPPASSFVSADFGATELQAGDRLAVCLYTTGTPCECRIQVLDDFDRVIAQHAAAATGEAPIRYEHLVQPVPSMNLRVRAELWLGGLLLQRLDSPRKVLTPADRALRDFEVFMCPQNRGHGDHLPLVGRLSREMGVTGLYPGSPKTLTMSGAKGLGVYWYHRGPYVERKEQYFRTKDKAYLQRVPCLNDPALWNELQERVTSTIGQFRKYGPVSYFANDEGSITCYVDELDLCFCPHCLSGMRQWLQASYGGLEELNRVWRTDFRAWEDVVPFTLEEAQSQGKFAPWADHRIFMERTFTASYKKIAELVRAADPGGVIRMSGCQASTAYSGYDYYQLHQHVGYFEAYGVGNQFEYHRSFARPNTIIGGWYGYGADGIGVQNSIWNALFHNLTLISLFWEYSCLNPDFTYSRSAQDMSKAFLEIRREGIGKLLLYGAKRDSLGIAVHYSIPSIHGAHLQGDTPRFESNRQGWIDLLEDLGCQYNFVATQQIEAGFLLDSGCKLLILPYSIALTEEEAAQIKRFVAGGGTVVGDFQTGIMDVHNVVAQAGQLDEVFGIERLSVQARPFYINKGFRTNSSFRYFDFNLAHIPGREDGESGLTMAEIGTRVKDGQAAYVDDFMGTVASVVVNEYGNGGGKGVYLNLSLDGYPKLRRDGSGFGLRALMKHILAMADVSRPAVLRDGHGNLIEFGYETVYYADGEARYVAVQSKLEARALGHDGLAVGGGQTGSSSSNRVAVEFDRVGHVYSIRDKAYLGFTDRVEVDLPHGEACLFSILPVAVNGVHVELAAQRVQRGETVQAVIRVDSERPNGSYGHVLNVNVYNPAGEYEGIYSENRSVDASGGEWSWSMPFNAQAGEWTIVAKDVATGVSARAVFEVE